MMLLHSNYTREFVYIDNVTHDIPIPRVCVKIYSKMADTHVNL